MSVISKYTTNACYFCKAELKTELPRNTDNIPDATTAQNILGVAVCATCQTNIRNMIKILLESYK